MEGGRGGVGGGILQFYSPPPSLEYALGTVRDKNENVVIY